MRNASQGRPDYDPQRALVLEVELPNFYCDDLPELLAEYGTDEPLGEQILREIGEVYHGLLTVVSSGPKGDSETIRTPVLMVGARVEERPPTPAERWQENLDDFAARIDEPVDEARVRGAMDAARVRVYERLLSTLAKEYTGQVALLAQQALDEARIAEDEAEKRESERTGIFG